MASGSTRLMIDFGKALYFGLWGAGGGFAGALAGELVRSQPISLAEVVLEVGLWFSVIGGSIALALLLAAEKYTGRSLRGNAAGIRRISFGTVFGAASGFVSGAIAQTIFSGFGATEPLRVLCWAIAGGLLGFAVSFRIRNLNWRRGSGGGFTGGAAGGIMFIVIATNLGTTPARLAGITAIGCAIGLMITLADTFFRKAWLEIRYSPNEVKTLTLGNQPIRIGSDPAACDVYVKDIAGVAYIYRFESGQILCEDMVLGKKGPVTPGVAIVLGKITLTPQAAGGQIVDAQASRFSLSLTGGRQLDLTEGSRFSSRDLPGVAPGDAGRWVAEVIRNRNDPSVVGLKNLSDRIWSAVLPAGGTVKIDPGLSLRLQAGARIDFGPVTAEIQMTDLSVVPESEAAAMSLPAGKGR